MNAHNGTKNDVFSYDVKLDDKRFALKTGSHATKEITKTLIVMSTKH